MATTKEVEPKEVDIQEAEVQEVEVIELPAVELDLVGGGTIATLGINRKASPPQSGLTCR